MMKITHSINLQSTDVYDVGAVKEPLKVRYEKTSTTAAFTYFSIMDAKRVTHADGFVRIGHEHEVEALMAYVRARA